MSIAVIIGAVVFVVIVVQAIKASVRRENAERNAPYEEGEK